MKAGEIELIVRPEKGTAGDLQRSGEGVNADNGVMARELWNPFKVRRSGASDIERSPRQTACPDTIAKRYN